MRAVRIGGPPGDEEIESDVVVLAAGSWSKRLGETAGVPIPLQPAKGYSATVDAFEGAPQIPVYVKERRVVVTPLGGRVRFGGTLELAGFEPEVVIPRFLPYTVKDSRLPVRAELIQLYLRTPILWKIFGKQMFVVARRAW